MQVNFGRLAVRGEPCEGESFRGFVLRLVEANRLAGLKVFFGKSGRDFSQWSRSVDHVLLERVSSASGASRETLEHLGGVLTSRGMAKWGTLETPLPQRFSGMERCKVCPRCVADNGYLQGIWEISMLAACPIHGCKLLYDCPKCDKPLTWTRRTHLHCCKEAPFDTAQTEQADDRAIELARLLASKFQRGVPEPSPRVCEQIKALSGEQIALLMLFAGLRPEDGASDVATYRARADMDYMETLVLRAADALLDWPAGMASFSAAWDGATDSTSVRAVKDLGNLYPRLLTQLKDPAFAFFRDEIWDRKATRSPLLSMAEVRSKKAQTTMLTGTVRKTYGVKQEWLDEWTTCGGLERTNVSVGAKTRHLYDRKQIEGLLDRLAQSSASTSGKGRAPRLLRPRDVSLNDEGISQREAARRLGVKYQEVPDLVQQGFINGLFQNGVQVVDPDSLQKLLHRLSQLSCEQQVTYRYMLGKGQLVRLNLRAEAGGIIKRLKAVFEGQLRSVTLIDGKGLSRFAISSTDLAAFGTLVNYERQWARMAEASAILNCPAVATRILIDHGYIETTPAGSKKSQVAQRHILRSSLTTFQENWVLGSSLAGSRKVNTHLYRELAKRYGPPVLAEGGVQLWPRHVVDEQHQTDVDTGRSSSPEA